jgi:hypothetical protein
VISQSLPSCHLFESTYCVSKVRKVPFFSILTSRWHIVLITLSEMDLSYQQTTHANRHHISTLITKMGATIEYTTFVKICSYPLPRLPGLGPKIKYPFASLRFLLKQRAKKRDPHHKASFISR